MNRGVGRIPLCESSSALQAPRLSSAPSRASSGIAVARLVFASLITFGILVGMVIGVVLAAMVSMGEVN